MNSSAFLYNWSNLQVTVFENTSAVTVNAAKAKLYGVDLDMQLQVSEHLNISAGVELLKDSFTSYPSAPFNVPQTLAQGGGTIGVAEDATGNKLPYAPDASFNAVADYNVPLPAGHQLGFNVTYYYNAGFKTTPDNYLGQSHYQLINARVEWGLPDKHTTFSLWGKNLSDQLYAGQVRANNNPGGYESQTFSSPRTYGVSARYTF
jgi:iron complex outermembrane receptor protein